jgi:hypothetical protein
MLEPSLFSSDQPTPLRDSVVSGYRSLATHCKRDAERAESQEIHDQLLSMAERWDLLASETERAYWA